MTARIRKTLDCIIVGKGWALVFLVLLVLLASVLEGFSVAAAFGVVTVMLNDEMLARLPVLTALRQALGDMDADLFKIALLAGFAVLYIGKTVLALTARLHLMRFSARNAAAAATMIVGGFFRRPYRDAIQVDTADLLSINEHAIPQTYVSVLQQSLIVAAETLTALAIVAALIALAPLVSGVTIGLLVGFMALYHLAIRRYGTRLGQRLLETKRGALRLARDQLVNAKQVRLHDRADFFVAQFARARGRLERLEVAHKFQQALPRATVETVVVIVFLGWISAAILAGVPAGEIGAMLGMFGVAALRLMPSSQRILLGLVNLRMGGPALDRVWNELTRARRHQAAAPQPTLDKTVPAIAESLRLERVSFAYPGTETASLTDISLEIRRGQAVAFMGPSGAGKSTLVDIVSGLLPPSGGRVLIDGRAADAEALRGRIGYVPQTILLMNGSLRENIAFGVPPEEIDEAALARAVSLAHLEEVVAGLPQGLDTGVGEFGGRLSGGQRQRVGIARALYHDPEIVILDEATSALDAASEAEIARAVAELKGLKTVLVIAHDIALVRSCDVAFMLRDGRLQARLDPAELADGPDVATLARPQAAALSTSG